MTAAITITPSTAASPAVLTAPAADPADSSAIASSRSATAPGQSPTAISHSGSFLASEMSEHAGRAGDVAGCACDVARSDDDVAGRALPLPAPGSACSSSSLSDPAGADVTRRNANGAAVQSPAAAGSLPIVTSRSAVASAPTTGISSNARGSSSGGGNPSVLGSSSGGGNPSVLGSSSGAEKLRKAGGGDLGLREKTLAAGAAAVISAVIMNPLDVVKTRLQAQTAPGSSHTRSPPPPLAPSPLVSITSHTLQPSFASKVTPAAVPGTAATAAAATASATASASASPCCRPAAFCSRHPAFHPSFHPAVASPATAATARSAAAFCSHHRSLFPSIASPALTSPARVPSAALTLAQGGQAQGGRAAMSVCCEALGAYGAYGASGHGASAQGAAGAYGHGVAAAAVGITHRHANVSHLLEHQHLHPHSHHHPHPHHPYRNTWDVFARIIKEEGALRLWRGTGASLLMAVPTVGIYLPIYDVLRAELESPSRVSAHGGGAPLLPAVYAPLVAGSVARALACVCCAPLELARTRMQAQRGVVTAGVGAGGAAAAGVGGVGVAAGVGAAGAAVQGAAAAAGGGLGVSVKGPGAANPTSTLATMRTIMHTHTSGRGLRALWTGVDAQLARDVPFSAICWGLLEPTRRYLLNRSALQWEQQQQQQQQETGLGLGSAQESSQLPLLQVVRANFTAGVVAGSVAAALTHPLDVAKTRRQIQTSGPSLNTARTLQHLWREGGRRALFAGASPRVLRAGPSCGIVVAFYEVVKRLLNNSDP